MTPSNIATLDKHYHHWLTLRDGGYLRGLNVHERTDMHRVLQEEFWPGYVYDEWCGSCVADMVKEVYSRYDKWKAEQPKAEPIVVAASFPVHDKPEDEILKAAMDTAEKIGPIDLKQIDSKQKNHRRK
jgi:hypothetical protein